jgi:ureidoglycolate hydrolase
MREIKARVLASEAFAPFGKLLIPTEDKITFSNEKVRHYNAVGTFDTMGRDPAVSFFTVKRRDFVLDSLERHVRSSEIFFPVRGAALMPFAPTLPDGSPDIANIRVFVCGEGAPFTCERGVWHLFPFPVGERYDSYVIVERALIEEDLEVVALKEPVRIVL